MDEQNVVHTCNGISLGHKGEWRADPCYNMDEPSTHPAKWMKPDEKRHICFKILFTRSIQNGSIHRDQHRSARSREQLCNGRDVCCWGDGNVLEPDASDSCTGREALNATELHTLNRVIVYFTLTIIKEKKVCVFILQYLLSQIIKSYLLQNVTL